MEQYVEKSIKNEIKEKRSEIGWEVGSRCHFLCGSIAGVLSLGSVCDDESCQQPNSAENERSLTRSCIGKHGGQGASAANQARQQTRCKQRQHLHRSSATERGERRRRRQQSRRDSARVSMSGVGATLVPPALSAPSAVLTDGPTAEASELATFIR